MKTKTLHIRLTVIRELTSQEVNRWMEPKPQKTVRRILCKTKKIPGFIGRPVDFNSRANCCRYGLIVEKENTNAPELKCAA